MAVTSLVARKEASQEVVNAYLEMKRLGSEIGQLKKLQDEKKEILEKAFGKAKTLKTPDGAILQRKKAENPGFTVQPFSYYLYKLVAKKV